LQYYKPKLFADDANIFIAGYDIDDLVFKANDCLDRIALWCLANKVVVNTDKTNYIIFHKSVSSNKIPEKLNIHINDNIIGRVKSTRFLGIIIDETLSWKMHIDMITSKLRSYTGIFYNISDYLNFYCLRNVYFALIHSHLLYCIEIYVNTYDSYVDKLIKMNNKVIRILFKKDFRTHVIDLYKCVNTLSLINLHKFNIIKLTHRCIYHKQSLPNVFHNKLQISYLTLNYCTRRKYDLFLPRCNTVIGKRVSSYKCSLLWNSLPEDIKSIFSARSFLVKLKDYFYKSNI